MSDDILEISDPVSPPQTQKERRIHIDLQEQRMANTLN